MRTMQWFGRLRSGAAWGIGSLACLCFALVGCGNGGTPSDLEVVVKVNGAQVAGPFEPSQQSVTVTSGDEVVIESANGASFSVTPDQVEITEQASAGNSYRFVPISMGGGAAAVQVASLAEPADRLTLALAVQSHRFDRRTWTTGETVVNRTTRRDQTPVDATYTVTASQLGYSWYQEVHEAYNITHGYDLDGNHTYRYDSWYEPSGDYWDAERCTQTPGRMIKAFPLFVGKAWDTRWEEWCFSGDNYRMGAHNQVIGFETVTVPAGTFPSLHIRSDFTWHGYVGGPDEPRLSGTTDCWWSVDLKQDVICIDSANDGTESSRVEAVQLPGRGSGIRAAK